MYQVEENNKVVTKPKGRQSDFARLAFVKTIWPPKIYEYPIKREETSKRETDSESDVSS